MSNKSTMLERVKAINEEIKKIEKDLLPLYEAEGPNTSKEDLARQNELETQHQTLHDELVDLYDKLDDLE